MVQFYIICTGYNCAPFVQDCVFGLVSQTYPNFKAILINDGSTDNTSTELENYAFVDERIEVKNFTENRGAAKRRYDAIHNPDVPDDAVIVLVGLDDFLLPNALDMIRKQYEAGKYMTYGNWINQKGLMLPNGFMNFPPSVHYARSYRQVYYRSTAANTFYKFLFVEIPESDFIINGKWIDTTTESEVMFSCLEMSGRDRIGIIETPIYFYRENLPQGTLKRLGREYKYEILKIITSRPKKNLYGNKRSMVAANSQPEQAQGIAATI